MVSAKELQSLLVLEVESLLVLEVESLLVLEVELVIQSPSALVKVLELA